jgi:sRNA-binding carbon storage regulator CsrA
VHRQEVYDQIREENRRAAAPAGLPASRARLVKQPDGTS